MELICVRRPGKKDGKLRLYWRTNFQVPVVKQGNSYVVGDGSLKSNHRDMKHLTPVLVMFDEWLENESAGEGVIASIGIPPEDLLHDGGRGLSRVFQRLKDSFRNLHPKV